MHDGLDHCDALKANGCSDAAVSEGKIHKAAFRMLDIRGTVVASGKSFPEELEEAFITYMDGIDDDRDVVAERGRKFWRISKQT